MGPLPPLRYFGGYLPIEDHGLIGDGATAALIGRDGTIWWMCIPRFDSPPLFDSIIDVRRGSHFAINPENPVGSRQFYVPDTGVLVTEILSQSGLVSLTDALALRTGTDLTEDVEASRRELIRSVVVLEGNVDLSVVLRFALGTHIQKNSDGFQIQPPEHSGLEIHLSTSVSFENLHTKVHLSSGERLSFALSWSGTYGHATGSIDEVLNDTVNAWQRWIQRFRYAGPQKHIVRRSAITLKLLDHFSNGSIVAAPTSSLPERIGGRRNWDYRYSWIRDAAFSVYALHRIGFSCEARGFLGWVLDAIERGERPRVLYDVGGNVPPKEREDYSHSGYQSSLPVRWGNAAAEQIQHDVYGEILDCAYQWSKHHGSIEPRLWDRLRKLITAAGNAWRNPDHGIWEVRTSPRPFTYSAALCQVALDRGARIAEFFGFPEDIAAWRKKADTITSAILEEAWDPEFQSLTEHLGGGGLDASLLSLPLRRVIRADHPKMIATTEAIRQHLGAGNGLLYRYRIEESPDGLPDKQGAFLLCSFWLVDNWTAQGRIDEAMALYESLCGRASSLGLFSEQVDPASGTFLGNFPQALSHIGAISAGFNLACANAR
ncbi:MAG TPA: glycoside hydrolase family 15 protein [Terriglobia bacterium]|nr:glycoside hydrolase family 15 protein [Terriglobia bacterium]